ncbi:MAG: hypothetical protein ABIF01_05685 [Candidatus Micrarchaeota archaeon]
MANGQMSLQHTLMRGKYEGGKLPDYARVNLRFLKQLPETDFKINFGGFDHSGPVEFKGNDGLVEIAARFAAKEGRDFSIISGLTDFRAEAQVSILRAFKSNSGYLFVTEPLEVSFKNQTESGIFVVSTSVETDIPARGIEIFLREGLGHTVSLRTASPRKADASTFVEGVYSGIIADRDGIINSLLSEKSPASAHPQFDFHSVVSDLRQESKAPEVLAVLEDMLKYSDVLIAIAKGDQQPGAITDAGGKILFREEDVTRLSSLINAASKGRTLGPADSAILNTAQEVAQMRKSTHSP